MSKVSNEELRIVLLNHLRAHRKNELLSTYLFFTERKYGIQAYAFPKGREIYGSMDELVEALESKNKLWRETEIQIQYGQSDVDSETKRVYICPFTGKVFGDNTHPNPQDAIYDWVANCPENNERIGGLRSKRFFVSEDPEIIKNYIGKHDKTVTKTVYSSVISGKLFNSKDAVIADFKEKQVKPIALVDIFNQNRFEIEPNFLAFLQKELLEEKIASFVEELSEFEEFASYIEQWTGEDEEEA